MALDPKELAMSLLEHGADWADKEAAAALLEYNRTVLRSQIATKFLPDAGSVAKAVMIAESTKEYADHIRDMVEARRLANRAEVQYNTDKAYIDLSRSQESTERAAMNMR